MIAHSTSANNAKLSILLPNSNKALSDALKQASPEQLVQLKEGKDLKSVLVSLFHAKIENTKSDALLLDLLKNSAVFKNMGNFTEDLKSLLATLKSDSALAPKSEKIEQFLQPLSTIDSTNLKEKIANSGIFMESKLVALLEKIDFDESLHHDLKAQLLSLREEVKESPKIQEQIDQLTTQIDYQQLLSHLSSSTSLYLPFEWDQLQQGSLSIKKAKGDKFYCEINLTLKEYGEMTLIMGLYDENQLEIQVQTEKKELKTLIQEHLGELRAVLVEAGITPRSIRIYDTNEIIIPKTNAYISDDANYSSSFQERV
ncbi:MAG: flagellar hook-length control protein FliK [Campylobacterales bacterium]|nr:flagellar hook-length control protein FliK [Campylobacterales bacterium]